MDEQPDYHAYLLRLWRESDAQAWRITLENAHTQAQHGFVDLKGLTDFLEQQVVHSGGCEQEKSPK